jgi:23S rRNA (adenine2503-C2)-methyltransferase
VDDIRDFTLEELEAELAEMGEPAYRAGQIFGWLYGRGAKNFEAFSDLPKGLRQKLSARFSFRPIERAGTWRARDGTEKILFRLPDGRFVETVLIPSGRRRTVCLSTQVGCKFACVFCASGRRGFKRNLAPSEIIGQVLFLREELEIALTNVVFMGMGEPLDNFDNVVRSIRILNDPKGLGIAARRITVSTSGIVPGIERFKDLGLQVNLSISLHAPDEVLRGRLMPVGRKYPLAALLRACEDYLEGGGRKLTLEYVLIEGQNDRPADAARLAGIARRLRAKVNLILYSPVEGLPFQTPSDARVEAFSRVLEEKGVGATIRKSKGRDIEAACGQLAMREK